MFIAPFYHFPPDCPGGSESPCSGHGKCQVMPGGRGSYLCYPLPPCRVPGKWTARVCVNVTRGILVKCVMAVKMATSVKIQNAKVREEKWTRETLP